MTCRCHSHNGFVLRPSEEGLAQRKDVRREGVDMETGLAYVDKVGSVSGLVEVEVMEDIVYDSKHIELNLELVQNGS